ncbi:hypothetical protein ACFVWL_03735 [Microbacterium sp. NPDC058269]|uniref:hypothetical protein n=1 Tax=Microbacterium sp. NPDC058269 TaxID=3346414 RepID=UPI0036DD5379
MNTHPTTADSDRALARRIAVLMRVGTLVAALLLSSGVVLSGGEVPGVGARQFGTVLLMIGCTMLVLLPVARLLLMAAHFARTDRLFLWVSVLVLALVVAGGALGLLVPPR